MCLHQVFQACGGRGEEGTQSSVSDEPKKKGKSVTALEYKASHTTAVRLEVQVCVSCGVLLFLYLSIP